MKVFTIGHGAQPLESFLRVLTEHRIERLVDVRRYPASRRHPHFARGALAKSCEAVGVRYQWRPELGGRRKSAPGSPHSALRSASFRGYADYMGSPQFQAALEWLERSSARVRTAIMCAETLWWNCHRKLIADALVARGVPVEHILPSGTQPHALSPEARLDGGRLIYDVRPRALRRPLGDDES